MQWTDLKARLLAVGQAHLTGEPAEHYIARSAAGPGAGGSGAVFLQWEVTGSSLHSAR